MSGGQRPYQTIIPGMATRGGEPGHVLWGDGRVQAAARACAGVYQPGRFRLDPQQALDALRFHVDVEGKGSVQLESGAARKTVAGLRRRGHDVEVLSGLRRTVFGGGQVIARDPETGVLLAGSEPRRDGAAVGW